MTSLLEGARRLVARGSDLGGRIEALQSAVEAARGRLDDETVDQASEIVERAASRLRLSADHTVVAIAGATGSGKSSTFNSLTGLELSAVGVRRPTTSWATACVWGSEGAQELLEWLGIPPRHQTTRDSMLDAASLVGRSRTDHDMDGVVLLDLPDHDSTEVAHHLEVDRIVKLADLLVWVLDPQKYADAAVHDRYLAPLASHADITVVVLNHIDTVPADRRATMLEDVRRLLDQDGLRQVPVIATSARQGDGIAELRAEIVRRVADKKSTRQRIEADLRSVAARLERGVRHRKAPLARRRSRAGDGRGAGRVRGGPDRGHRGGSVHPAASRPGHRLAGDLLDVAAQAGPAPAAPPRPRPLRPASGRAGAHLDPRGESRATGQGRRRGPRAGRRRVGGDDPAMGGGRQEGLDLAAGRDG